MRAGDGLGCGVNDGLSPPPEELEVGLGLTSLDAETAGVGLMLGSALAIEAVAVGAGTTPSRDPGSSLISAHESR